MKSADQEELPEGWVWCTFKDISRHSLNGYGKRRQDTGEPAIVLRLADIREQEVSLESPRHVNSTVGEVEKYRLEPDDLLAIRVNGSPDLVGRLIHFPRAREPILFCDHFIRLRLVPGVMPKMVRLYGDTPAFRWHVETTKVSSAGQNTISQKSLEHSPIPLPPLAEQKRIVAKVEALLARVNLARQRLAKVPAILKRFRQSVLGAACSGRLSVDWREEREGLEPASALLTRLRNEGKSSVAPERDGLPDLPAAWAWGTPKAVATEIVDCPHSTPRWADSGLICLRTTNFRPGLLDLSEVRYVSKATYQERIARLEPKACDVVYSREGGILGIACMIPPGVTACLGQRMMLFRVRPDCSPEYFMHVLNSPLTIKRVQELTGGTASPHLNVGDIKQFPIPLPPTGEQYEIVRRVEALFRLADAIEKRVAGARGQAEKLTQAILAKAFRGDLVPTEAELARREGREYEPACALLERIRAESQRTLLASAVRWKPSKQRDGCPPGSRLLPTLPTQKDSASC